MDTGGSRSAPPLAWSAQVHEPETAAANPLQDKTLNFRMREIELLTIPQLDWDCNIEMMISKRLREPSAAGEQFKKIL